MGAGGAAVARSLGQGLQAYLAGQQQQTQQAQSAGFIPGADFATFLRLAGMDIPEGANIPPVPTNFAPGFFSALARGPQTSQSPASSATGEQLGLAVEALTGRRAPSQFGNIGVLPTSAWNTVLQEAIKPPPITVTTTPEMQARGLGPIIPLDQYSTARTATAPAVEAPQEIVNRFPSMKGVRMTAADITEWAQADVEMSTALKERADAEKAAEELYIFKTETRGNLITPEVLRRQLERMGFEPDHFFYPEPNEDGFISVDQFWNQNEGISRAAETFGRSKLVRTQVKGQELSNMLSELDLTESRVELAKTIGEYAGQAGLSPQEASALQSIIPGITVMSDREASVISNMVEAGRSIGGAWLDMSREKLKEQKDRARLTEQQANLAERTLNDQALIIEANATKAQGEVEEVPLNILWIDLGLPGQPPSGLKVRWFQMNKILDLLDRKKGTVITARNLFEAAGVDTTGMPKEVLDANVEVDSAGQLAGAINTLVNANYAPIRTMASALGAIIEFYSPMTNDVFSMLLMSQNPEMFRGAIMPMIDFLPDDLKKPVETGIETILRQMGGMMTPGLTPNRPQQEVGGAQPQPAPGSQAPPSRAPVQFPSWASQELKPEVEQAIKSAGSAKAALRVAQRQDVRAGAIGDTESVFYNDPYLWEQFLNLLSYYAGGE